MKRIFSEVLHLGSAGPDVLLLQLILKIINHDPDKMQLDGMYDERTAHAVVAFQATIRVDEDSVFGPETRAALLDRVRLKPNTQIVDFEELMLAAHHAS